MTLNTFVHAECMPTSTLTTYRQQYTKLANLVRDSWRRNHHASDELKVYLGKLAKEDHAWLENRENIVKTMWKLRKMLPEHQYVQAIHALDDKLDLLTLLNNKTTNINLSESKEETAKVDGVYTNKGDKLSAIGDLHGDFEATIRVLRNMNIIHVNTRKHRSNVRTMAINMEHQLQKLEHQRVSELPYQPLDYTAYTWIYANNMLVQTGDLFDRGLHSREIIELFMHLDSTAGDGQVVNMAGNHEFMQYQYGMSEMDWHYPMYNIPKDSMSFGKSHNWDSNRTRNLAPGSKYFHWIAQLPIVVYETKSKTIFSHGCIVEKWTNVRAINKSVRETWGNVRRSWEDNGIVDTILHGQMVNQESPLNCAINGIHTEALSEVDGPVWNRYYNNAVRQGKTDTDQLKRTVESFAAQHMQVDRLICAHTITNMQGLGTDDNCEFKPEQHPVNHNPSVWFIDIGMTEGYGKGKRWGGVELTTSNGMTRVEAKHPHC